MFAPGMSVGVAVSGGADSVCLLHVLRELAPRWNLHLRVLHLDHKLRGEASREDARFVAALAAELGLPFELREADVAAAAGNLEQAARRARRSFFLDALAAGRVQRVALGHTRNDQAETVLYRFLRGAGTAGLAGMLPVTADGLVRPLLATPRAEVEEHLRARNLIWREDASNQDLRFDRNRIRHSLLPSLAVEWNPALADILAGMARVAADEEEYWRQEIDRTAGEVLLVEPRAVVIDVRRLAALPRAVARRLVRQAIERVKGDLRSIDVRHIEAVLALAARTEGHGRAQIPGVHLVRSFEWLRLAPAAARFNQGFSLLVDAAGLYAIPSGEIEVRGEIEAALHLRNWRPGDALKGAGKIKDLFQEKRIPIWKRNSWPVLEDEKDRIVWARQFGASPDCPVQVVDRDIIRTA
ncbi:MAG: tRNA lysidine(34) synthetase TilS [Acidobacteria bacterium]|nr:tRNA lysidine(34) synthetase TilS [Acidobacteriota bacterium]